MEHITITHDQQLSKVGNIKQRSDSSCADDFMPCQHDCRETRFPFCLHSRVTQQSPSWLPLVEKHDIPIVVGVGVSLAFIFIAVFFYSVVQKNEPAPPSRAGERSSAHIGLILFLKE